jgi:hypothetical protein
MDTQKSENWKAALSALTLAEIDVATLPDTVSNEMLDGYCGSQMNWLQIVMGMKAPDHAALAEKLRLFKQHDCRELIPEIVNPMLDAMLADAEMLAEGAI